MKLVLQKSSPHFLFLIMVISSVLSCSDIENQEIRVLSDSQGHRLQVNGEDFIVNGMNWDYFPIGTTYSYNLWEKPDSFIINALEHEMSLLQDLGVNTLRQYSSVPPRWVKYIYEAYGIFTTLNHPFARYGFMVDGNWVANVDYSSPALREALLADIAKMIDAYKDIPGVLIWLLGNENNYGLHWNSAETSDIPDGDSPRENQARHLYSLMDEAINLIHDMDADHPVAIANGDLLYIDIIVEEIENMDIFGTNVYRGESFEDLFEIVDQKLNVPIVLTEFGADAYNAVDSVEDQESQAKFLIENWHELYSYSHGKENPGNSIGGFTFQFSDGWWKFGIDSDLSTHDNHASWSNGGYSSDFIPGINNMNEEWFGICAKGPTDEQGYYELHPRLAYYALQKVHQLNPYAPGLTLDQINLHFSKIQP